MDIQIEFVAPSGKPTVPFVIGDVYEDGDHDHFLLTKMPDNSGFVWVNLTQNTSSSVVDEGHARHIANGLCHIPDAKVLIPVKKA
jgi:hypothetical protein